jgi:hypothetical protein
MAGGLGSATAKAVADGRGYAKIQGGKDELRQGVGIRPKREKSMLHWNKRRRGRLKNRSTEEGIQNGR